MANLSNINNYFVVDTTGKVAIGDVSAATIPTLLTQLTLYDNTATASLVIQSGAASGKKYELGSSSTGKFQITDLDASVDRLTVDTNGLIGIGTTSPKSNLEVIGGVNISTNTTSATTTTMRIGSYGSSSQTYYGAKLVAHTNFGATANTDLSFDLGGLGEVMRLHSSGSETRVGIGTTSPVSVLHIKDNSAGNTELSIQSNDFTRAEEINFLNPSTSAISGQIKYYTNPTVEYMSFSTSNNSAAAERMRISAAGNVGIGTTAPAAKLHVENTNAAIVYVKSTINNQNASIWFNSNSGGTQADRWEIGTNISAGTDLEFFDRLNSVSRMVIQNDGNVGIGTTAPSRELDIQAGSGWAEIALRGASGAGGSLEFWTTTTKRAEIFADTEDIVFRNTATNQERMRITSAGNVVIGTSTSSNKLFVANGSIAINNSHSFMVGGDNDTAIGRLKNTAGVFNLEGDGTRSIRFGSGTNGEVVRIDNTNERVGIGITTPQTTLQVNGAASALNAHFGQGTNNSSGVWGGISLGYSEGGNASYRKVGIVAKATGDGAARQELHFLVDTNADSGSASIADSKMMIDTSGNVGIGYTAQSKKLAVNGGMYVGNNNTDAGASKIYGDRKYPQATYFVKRNYNLTAGSSAALYSIARQWHDHANWGLGHINVIMWGIYYGKNNFNKADFSCRYGYSGGAADVVANFNPGSLAIPTWTSATQVSGNIHYRDLQIQIPQYWQISFEIISPGCVQTYDINNTANNTVYLYPH